MCAVRAGFEPAVQLPVRQFSKLVVLATHPPHQLFSLASANIRPFFGFANFFAIYFYFFYFYFFKTKNHRQMRRILRR
jgi:hypothetical protein